MWQRVVTLERAGLAGYVRAVARALGVPGAGTACESETRCAGYIALPRRCAECPGRDGMVEWSARRGWSVVLEETPEEASVLVARLGAGLVPAPDVVADFVGEVLAGRRTGGRGSGEPAEADQGTLRELLVPYALIAWPPG
nr:DUF6292 family protein [Amycolatopsis jejuensis]